MRARGFTPSRFSPSSLQMSSAAAPSQISNYKATDVDDVEVLISAEKGLVFHRSASRESVFFFPPQNIYSVPLGDNGSNRGRLEALRKCITQQQEQAEAYAVDLLPRGRAHASRGRWGPFPRGRFLFPRGLSAATTPPTATATTPVRWAWPSPSPGTSMGFIRQRAAAN